MQRGFAKKLGLLIWKTKVGAWKNDCSKLKTFGIVITCFLINDKDEKSCFFEETFLLADISMNITFEMLFLTLNNAEVNFNN